MMLGDAEAKIVAVLKSLHENPRNAYEADNLYQLNCERIEAVHQALAGMSGDFVDQLRAKCEEAEKVVHAKRAICVVGSTGEDNAFSLDFAIEEAEAENETEMVTAMAAVASGSKRVKKSNGRDKAAKKKMEVERQKQRERGSSEQELAVAQSPVCGSSNEQKLATHDTPSVPTMWVVISRFDNLVSNEVPSAALLTGARGRCEPVPNTPLARVRFTADMEYEGVPCQCAVELYRCVIIAMAYGEPQLSWAECEEKMQFQRAAEVEASTSSKGPLSSSFSQDDCLRPPKTPSDSDHQVCQDDGALADDDLTLSEQLVAEYNLAQQADDESDTDTSTLPCETPARFQERLRSFTQDVWVILLCHGGYFSGGVFVRGSCVVHKTFQRYVVRKKQGGKQSSNAKDIGSYNSVGSQIRAAQEVKWRIDVRNILLDWIPCIQAASFILYAAPGPQNRAALTDFSLLPSALSTGGSKSVSPIQLKDPRVCRVPLTTHRPTFEEVKRIYSICSLCSVLYVKEATV